MIKKTFFTLSLLLVLASCGSTDPEELELKSPCVAAPSEAADSPCGTRVRPSRQFG